MAIQGKRLTKRQEDKILSEKLLNPEATLREIAKEADVSYVSVMNVLDKSSELLKSINTDGRSDIAINTLDTIIREGNKVIAKFISAIEGNPDESIPVKTYGDLTAISGLQEKAFKQKQLIEGKPTERVEVGDYRSMTDDQLAEEHRKHIS